MEGARKLPTLDGFARKRRLRFSNKTKVGLVRTCNVWQCCAVRDAAAGQCCWGWGLRESRDYGGVRTRERE